ncbi:dihydroxy-acid dehydratase 1 domain protein [Mycobacteroides abscessus]|nr:dihydroxy-acid dehydratase 1 domain protein [Mycobacteroides abscessus]
MSAPHKPDSLRASGSSQPDIKPVAATSPTALEKTAARGMLRAVGMGDDDWVKPQIGVGSSWERNHPCNMSLQRWRIR